jgi:hypothetical protein
MASVVTFAPLITSPFKGAYQVPALNRIFGYFPSLRPLDVQGSWEEVLSRYSSANQFALGSSVVGL